MEITGITHGAGNAPAQVAVNRPADVQEISRAVKTLNVSDMFAPENELRFQKDPETQRMVIRMVNRTTGEVISQLPDEYVLRLAGYLKQE
jgi:flagellar protein FlaG